MATVLLCYNYRKLKNRSLLGYYKILKKIIPENKLREVMNIIRILCYNNKKREICDCDFITDGLTICNKK